MTFPQQHTSRPAPRYAIYAVANENCDAICAELLHASDDLATAKHLASEVVSPWGAAILDTESALIDYGFGFGVPVPEQGQDI